MTDPAAQAVLALAARAAEAYGRPDLGERIAAAQERLADPAVSVLVVGEFKQGKSTLVNALLNADVCPVDDDIATAVATVTRYGPEPAATATVGDTAAPIALDDVARYVTERRDADGEEVRAVEIRLPRKLLESGLSLVDTPGVGGLDSAHGSATLSALPLAEAVLFVSDASQELTASELDFLARAAERCPTVALVLSKIDVATAWRRVAELDAGHVARAGLDLPVLPVSSVVRRRAVALGDAALNAESGYPALVEFLRTSVLAEAERNAAAAAARDVTFVADQLIAHFRAERDVLADPERAAEAEAELAAARERAEALRAAGSRWQTTLNDGLTDLSSDVDHDLRRRFRELTAQIDERIDAGDPGRTWDELDPWIQRLVADEVEANYRLLGERAAGVVTRVAELFAVDEDDLGLAPSGPDALAVLGSAGELSAPDEGARGGVVSSGLGVMRGAYGGMMMFGMLGGMVGVTMIAPVTVALGLAMGVKSLKDDRSRGLAQRRQQAKAAARKYLDNVSFVVGKDSRDALRLLQRELRDTLGQRAQELARSAQEALQAAQEAARTDGASREQRLADVDAEIARLLALRQRAEGLLA